MSVVPSNILREHRLARLIDNPDVIGVGEMFEQITDHRERRLMAQATRIACLDVILDQLSEPGLNLTAAQMLEVHRRMAARCREILTGIYPEDILAMAFDPPTTDQGMSTQ